MTTALAAAALALSVLSIAFTGYQWRQSAPGIKVIIKPNYTPWDRIPLQVDVISGGRMPVSVRAVKVFLLRPGDESMAWEVEPIKTSKPLPARLEPTDVLEVEFDVHSTVELVQYKVLAHAWVGARQVEAGPVLWPSQELLDLILAVAKNRASAPNRDGYVDEARDAMAKPSNDTNDAVAPGSHDEAD